MNDNFIIAYCNQDGLIGFATETPEVQFTIISGYQTDMNIVRKLAHRDSTSYWVPGVCDTHNWRQRLDAFREACSDHIDDSVTMYPRECTWCD